MTFSLDADQEYTGVAGVLTRWVGWWLLLGGLVVLGIGVTKLIAAAPASGWERTTGTVVDLDHHANGSAAPVVRFTVDGQDYTVVGGLSTDPLPELGSTYPVAYDPSNPADAKVDSFGQLYGDSLAVGGLGLVLSGVGAGYNVYRRSKGLRIGLFG